MNPGTRIGPYEILSLPGTGGMGEVYRARDTKLNREVALKVLPPEKVADLDRKRRFIQEAKAASALNHAHIVHIYDISSDAGVDFIAMEYAEGKTLDHCIGRNLRLNDALKYGIQIADTLAEAPSGRYKMLIVEITDPTSNRRARQASVPVEIRKGMVFGGVLVRLSSPENPQDCTAYQSKRGDTRVEQCPISPSFERNLKK